MRFLLLSFVIFCSGCSPIAPSTSQPLVGASPLVSSQLDPIEPQLAPSPSPTPPWNQTPEQEWGAPTDTPLPNLVVVGDSISIGYTGPLYALLGSEYDVRHPQDNGRNSWYTSQHVGVWTSSADSIVVWNNGVWDCTDRAWHDEHIAFAPWEQYGTTDTEYETNLIATATQLKQNGSRVLFMTTTEAAYYENGPYAEGREVRLNEIAKRVLPPLGVEVYDLYTFAKAIPNAHPNITDVHFEKSASKLMAEYIVKAIHGEIDYE